MPDVVIKGERDPEIARLRLGEEFISDKDIDLKTELSDKQIFAFAAIQAFEKRVYTPRYIDVPYMESDEAIKLRQELLNKLSDPTLIKSPEVYASFKKAVEPQLEYFETVLSPMSEVVDVDGVKMIRKYTPAIVYDEFARLIMRYNVSKDRKSRWEILNFITVEKTLNGIKDLIGKITGEDDNKSLGERIKEMFN